MSKQDRGRTRAGVEVKEGPAWSGAGRGREFPGSRVEGARP